MSIFDGMTNEQIEKMLFSLGDLSSEGSGNIALLSFNSYLGEKYENNFDLGVVLLSTYLALGLTPEQIQEAKQAALNNT